MPTWWWMAAAAHGSSTSPSRAARCQGHDAGWARRSVLHVAELHEANGILTVDRNAPAYIHMLPPPINKKSDMAGEW